MTELFSFEKLDVYQKTFKFNCKIQNITHEVKTRYYWSDQLNRAATSVLLNLAEGSGRWHIKEKRNFYFIARGSIFECVPLIELGLSLRLLNETQRDELRSDCLSIAKMLTKLLQSLEKESQPEERITTN